MLNKLDMGTVINCVTKSKWWHTAIRETHINSHIHYRKVIKINTSLFTVSNIWNNSKIPSKKFANLNWYWIQWSRFISITKHWTIFRQWLPTLARHPYLIQALWKMRSSKVCQGMSTLIRLGLGFCSYAVSYFIKRGFKTCLYQIVLWSCWHFFCIYSR